MNEAIPYLERAHSLALDVVEGASSLPPDPASEKPGSREQAAAPDASPVELARALLLRLSCSFDGRYDPLACVREARQLAASLPEALQSPPLAAALEEAERWCSFVAFRPDAARARQLLSRGELTLGEPERPIIVPPTRAPVPAPPVVEPAPARPGFIADPLPALSADAWTRQRREDFFGEICALASQRVPQLGDVWRGSAFAEQRLLRDLDALVALDRATLGSLEDIVLDAPAPDPALLLGLTLVGGTLVGRDGLAMADRVFRHFEEEPGFAEAWVEGLSLAPHPLVPVSMRVLLEDPSPARRAIAIAVLARRGEATTEELFRACYDDDVVRAQALVPFVLRGDARTRVVLDELQDRVARSELAPLRDAFLEAGALAGSPYAQSLAANALRAGSPLAARLFGVAAERGDAEALLEWTAIAPSVDLVDALGWAGDPACLPLLVGLLGIDDGEIVVSAASALERITGAGLRQWLEIPVEDAMEARVRKSPEPAPSTDRDPALEASPDRIEIPSLDQEAWRAHVEAHREQLVPRVRTRRGVPYTPFVSWYELDQLPCVPVERATLAHEISVRTGLLFPFDVRAFVPAQERRLAWLREPVERRSTSPGSWDRPMQRSAIEPPR